MSKARKDFYGEWTPWTLQDDTRPFFNYGRGYKDINEWSKQPIILDKFSNQKYYIELWFEAKAMKSQFEHYTKYIPLIPFGGDYTISPKWDTAQRIAMAYKKFKKPIVILYFGDCDNKGKQIPDNALKDIRKWAIYTDKGKQYLAEFDFFYCGLNIEQAKAYNLPTNPDNPNKYQWEALSDKQAQEIITTNIKEYQDKKKFIEIEKLQTEYENKIKSFVANI